MKKLLTLFLVAIIFQIPFSLVDSFGLSCAPQTLGEIYEQSDLVFLGTVTSKEYWPPSTEEAKITFEIHELLKGTYDKTIILSSNESFWGYNFGEGLQYVVFAQGAGEENQYYSVPLCTPVFYGFQSIVETIQSFQTKENAEIGDIEAWGIYEQLTDKEKGELEKIQEYDHQRIGKEAESRVFANNIFSYLVISGIIGGISLSIFIYFKRILKSRKISTDAK